MKWYGSVNNRIDERRPSKEPAVGLGVTEYLWSDRHAYEIIEVKDKKHFTMRKYSVKPIGGHYSNDWELISEEGNPLYNMVYRYGSWYLDCGINKYSNKREYLKMNIVIGIADYYYDYEF